MDKAIYYANQIRKLSDTITRYNQDGAWVYDYWFCLSSLNMAKYLYEKGNYSLSQFYMQNVELNLDSVLDMKNDTKVNGEFDALQILIKLKLLFGQLNEAEILLKRSNYLKSFLGINLPGNYFKPMRLYENYEKFYVKKGNYNKAYEYVKLANVLKDSLERRNDLRKLWQAEVKYKTSVFEEDLRIIKYKAQKEKYYRNTWIIVSIVITSASFLVYFKLTNNNKLISSQKLKLEGLLKDKDLLLKELHHRVKNNLQAVSGLLEIQIARIGEGLGSVVLKESQERIFSIALVHEGLYKGDNLGDIEIKDYIFKLSERIIHSNTLNNFDVHIYADSSSLNLDTAVPLGLIINELLSNCYRHAFKDGHRGEIRITFAKMNGEIRLVVADNGSGIPKGAKISLNEGVGFGLVRGLVRQLKGSVKYVNNEPGLWVEIICQEVVGFNFSKS